MLKVFIFFIVIFFSSLAGAARTAVVAVSKATVYADINLSSPIGFIKRGTQVAVGEVKRKRGRVIPMDLNGRVAWIKVNDLIIDGEEKSFDKKKRVKEHLIADSLFGKANEDPVDENNYLQLRYGLYTPNIEAEYEGSVTDSNDFTQEDYAGAYTSLFFEHRHPNKNHAWGAGLDYIAGEGETTSYSAFVGRAQFTWIPLKTSLFSVEAFAAFIFTVGLEFEDVENGKKEGIFYGADYGVLGRVFPYSKFGLYAGVSFTTVIVAQLKEFNSSRAGELATVKGISGAQAFGGISYRFD
jgi:hypothetical protein